MKLLKGSLLISLLVSVAFVSQAQTVVTEDLTSDVEMNQLNQMGQGKVAKRRVVVVEDDSEIVQREPVTYIEASPLRESRAEQIRKQRQEAEVETEMKIVEKLEVSRMEDEKTRAQVLFGKQFDQLLNPSSQQQQQQQPTYHAPPVVQSEPQVVPVQEKEDDGLKNEIRDLVSEIRVKKEETKPEKQYKTYFTLFGAMPDYDAKNVKTNSGFGIGIGMQELGSRWIFEGSLMYSQHDIEEDYDGHCYNNYSGGYYSGGYEDLYCNYGSYDIVKVDQYSLLAASKYMILDQRIKPFVGPVLAYHYRKYQHDIWDKYSTSHAVDVGLSAGVAFEVTDSFLISGDFKYMMLNVFKNTGDAEYDYRDAKRSRTSSYSSSRRGRYNWNDHGRPLEEVEQYIFTINAIFSY